MAVTKSNAHSMRLSWQEIRANAAAFSRDWKPAKYERGETQTFYNDFFNVFGVSRRRVATFEEPIKKLGEKQGFIDLFWKGVLLVEQKSAGRDLIRAKDQALDYFPGLKDYELPRFVLVSDFQTFELYDLEEGTEVRFLLADFHKHVESFGFILGVQKRTFRDQDPVNIKASELMGKLHDALKDSGYDGHDLERFLVRLLFCLFADDTGIFEPRDIFLDLITARTREDGADVGERLAALFEVLNIPVEKRQRKLDEDLAAFPYVNGDLFGERLPIPSFDRDMRKLLLEACEFSWDAISPAIFGSLFQSVMNKTERRSQGAHYTTERNILKVIEPLFLDQLHAELKAIKARRDNGRNNALRAFQEKLGEIKVFDPACGCGNFLIISYRELRALELDVLRELNPSGQRVLDISSLSKVNVDQFYGIEIGEFPARIAEVALWMMDHIMNNRLSLEFGEFYARIPLKVAPHIIPGDALEFDWNELLAPKECSYVLGNPPFAGAKFQSTLQREQVRRIAQLGGTGGTLDFVCAWFLKAAQYIQEGNAKIGFVATNSVTQGEQVAQLWPILFHRFHLEIIFAHRTFAWGSDARGVAHVHVVIVGLSKTISNETARLFSYSDINGEPTESVHRVLSPYLIDATNLVDPHIVVEERSLPLSDHPKLISGTQPVDDGNYIFDDDEKLEFLKLEPAAEFLFRPYVGSVEYINGIHRWIMCFRGVEPSKMRDLSHTLQRMRNVKEFRQKSSRAATHALANYPNQYNLEVIPDSPFLCIPKVSSERREYVPIGWLEPPTIPSDLVFVLKDAQLWHFGILTSKAHMAWLRHIGGKLKSDFRYSIGIVYNTFSWPSVNDNQKVELCDLAQAILDARLSFHGEPLVNLYDPDLMPGELRKCHSRLDQFVDRLYARAGFKSDRERVEALLHMYETQISQLRVPLLATTRRRSGRVSRSRKNSN
jgi:N-6 DNA Methylase